MSVENDHVVARSSCAVVVDLKVTSPLVESETVKEIVVDVGSVEQLRDRSINVC